MRKCIYCGKDEKDGVRMDASDIIPDALSYCKILNKNVCAVEHNQKFSDKFESEVIKKISFIRNDLDLRSSKSKSYGEYPVELSINNKVYTIKKFKGDSSILKKGKRLVSKDKKYLLGDYNDFLSQGKKEEDIVPVDINNAEMEKRINIDYTVFYSLEIFRLACKISFEWYCKENNICNRDERFSAIINYIVDGKSTKNQNLVGLIKNKEVYDYFNRAFPIPNHVLFSYEDDYGNVFCIVNLFGIALYRVWLCRDEENIFNEKRIFLTEMNANGELNKYEDKSYKEALKKLQDSPYVRYIRGKNTYVPIDNNHTNEYNNVSILPGIFQVTKKISTVNEYDEETVKLIIYRIQELLQMLIIGKRTLKRFVEEYRLNEDKEFNKKNPSGKFWTKLFVIYLIGKENIKNINENQIKNLLEDKFLNNGYRFTKDKIIELKYKLFSDNDYRKNIKRGAQIIRQWN